MNKKIKLLALLIGLSGSGAVMADGFMEGIRPYLAFGAGAMQADLDGYDKEVVGLVSVGGGLKINSSIAIEANILQSEDASFSRSTVPAAAITGVGANSTGEFGQETNLQGMSLGLVGFLPAGNKARFIVKADAVSVVADKESKTKTGDFTTGVLTDNPVVKSKLRHNYLAAGLGMERKITDQFFLRGLVQYYLSSDDDAPDLLGVNFQLIYAM